MLHQLCYNVDGSLLGANAMEGHQVGMMELSTLCKKVYEGACACTNMCVCRKKDVSMWSHANQSYL